MQSGGLAVADAIVQLDWAMGADSVRSRRLPALLLSLLLSDSSTTGANALKDFPAFAPGRFLALVDEELGFS